LNRWSRSQAARSSTESSKAGDSLAAIAVALNRLIAEERLTETPEPWRHELMNFFRSLSDAMAL
jgi:hypothetical protein